MTVKAVILAAGIPHLAASPALAREITWKSTLEWQLQSLGVLNSEIDIVIGFGSQDEAVEKNQTAKFIQNIHWKSTTSVGSLLLVEINDLEELWISYGDILYHASSIDQINNIKGSSTIAYDSDWLTRYLFRESGDIEKAEKLVCSDSTVIGLGSKIHT